MKGTIYYLIVFGTFLSACSSTAYLRTNDFASIPPPTNPNNIRIFPLDNVDRKYSIVGTVIACADAGSNASITVKHLQRQAAKLGADAIINMTLEYTTGEWRPAITASGTAVKYTN